MLGMGGDRPVEVLGPPPPGILLIQQRWAHRAVHQMNSTRIRRRQELGFIVGVEGQEGDRSVETGGWALENVGSDGKNK